IYRFKIQDHQRVRPGESGINGSHLVNTSKSAGNQNSGFQVCDRPQPTESGSQGSSATTPSSREGIEGLGRRRRSASGGGNSVGKLAKGRSRASRGKRHQRDLEEM
ncbi:unnamed protein product, partial [Musa acuminata subsp. burmannicoides]